MTSSDPIDLVFYIAKSLSGKLVANQSLVYFDYEAWKLF